MKYTHDNVLLSLMFTKFSSSSLPESITRSGSFLVSNSVKGSTSSLATSAIEVFKRSKPELSGFPGSKNMQFICPDSHHPVLTKRSKEMIYLYSLYQDLTKLLKFTEQLVLMKVRAYYLPWYVCGVPHQYNGRISLSVDLLVLFHDTSAA